MDNDRVKDYLLAFAIGAAFVVWTAVSFQIGRQYPLKLDSTGLKVKVDTLYQTDTIRLEKPVFVTKYIDRVQLVPVTDTIRVKDTLFVALEREVKEYGDESYRAVVSGVSPSLDEIEVYQKTKYIKEVVEVQQKAKRVGFGLAAGPGVFWNGGYVQTGVGVVGGVVINF